LTGRTLRGDPRTLLGHNLSSFGDVPSGLI
jgi:hypothetical protein